MLPQPSAHSAPHSQHSTLLLMTFLSCSLHLISACKTCVLLAPQHDSTPHTDHHYSALTCADASELLNGVCAQVSHSQKIIIRSKKSNAMVSMPYMVRICQTQRPSNARLHRTAWQSGPCMWRATEPARSSARHLQALQYIYWQCRCCAANLNQMQRTAIARSIKAS